MRGRSTDSPAFRLRSDTRQNQKEKDAIMISLHQFIRMSRLLQWASALVLCLGICSEVSAIHFGCASGNCDHNGSAGAAAASFTCSDGDDCGCQSCGTAAPVITERDPTFCKLPVPGYPAPFATPRPTVPTHLTYGPFMLHNSLPNYRGTYLIPQANGGPGGTQVHWRSQTGINALKRVHKAFEWAR